MGFVPEAVEAFETNFEKYKAQIRAFEGCTYLELLRGADDPTQFFTYSKWNSTNDLEAYRQSDLFKTVWAFTKKGFNVKPEAWSVNSLKTMP
jgi:hypothetical protein